MNASQIVFLTVFGIALPLLAWSSKRKLDAGLIVPRFALYLESTTLQLFVLAGSWYVAATSGFILFRDGLQQPFDWLGGAVLLALSIAAMFLGWRIAPESMRERLRMFLPVTASERLMWVGVSAAAAVAEEIAYRGVLVRILTRLLGSWWAAALVASVIFALAHLVQGWKSAAIIVVFAFAFHLLVRYSGGLVVAMAVHFVYDLVAGFTLGAYLRRRSVDVETL